MINVEETNAALDKEFAEQNPKAEDLSPKQGESKALEESLQTSSVATEKTEETVPDDTAVGSDGRPLLNTKGAYFPDDSHESNENARKMQTRLARDSEKKLENPSLLLEDKTSRG